MVKDDYAEYYEYDQQGRISQITIKELDNGKWEAYYDTFTYTDDEIIVRSSDGDETTYTLSNGRVEKRTRKYSDNSVNEYTYFYENNHLTLIRRNGEVYETTTWSGDNIIKIEAGEESMVYEPSNVDFLKGPMEIYWSGGWEFAAGILGTCPKYAPASEKYYYKDQLDDASTYKYETDKNGYVIKGIETYTNGESTTQHEVVFTWE